MSAVPPPPSNSSLPRRAWRAFRSQPWWLQAVAWLFLLGVVTAPFGDEPSDAEVTAEATLSHDSRGDRGSLA